MHETKTSTIVGFGLSVLFLGGCPPEVPELCAGAECAPVRGPAPKITRVTVEGNPSGKIRQGYGDAPSNRVATVHVTGEGLDGATSVDIGIPGRITANTATELTFTVAIPHGAAIGLQPVHIATPHGPAASAEGVTITAITSAPTGNDSIDLGIGSSGTDDHPFRSLAQALKLALPGDTIFLENGTYGKGSGDAFVPITGPSQLETTPNVRADVTIKGESKEGTKLDASGLPGNLQALVLEGNAHIETLGFSHFTGFSIFALNGTVTVKDVKTVTDYGFGASVAVAGKGNVMLDSVEMSGCGIVTFGEAKLSVTDSYVHGCSASGIGTYGGASMILTRTRIEDNGTGSLTSNPPDCGIQTASSTTLRAVTIRNNKGFGICTISNAPGATLDIGGSTFENNTGAAMSIHGPWSMKVRDTHFSGHPQVLYVGVGAANGVPSIVDLGTKDSPGGNDFTICSKCDGIFDDRPAPSTGSVPITVMGNNWLFDDKRADPPQGCSPADSPSAQPRFWHIAHPGTCTSTGNVILD